MVVDVAFASVCQGQGLNGTNSGVNINIALGNSTTDDPQSQTNNIFNVNQNKDKCCSGKLELICEGNSAI